MKEQNKSLHPNWCAEHLFVCVFFLIPLCCYGLAKQLCVCWRIYFPLEGHRLIRFSLSWGILLYQPYRVSSAFRSSCKKRETVSCSSFLPFFLSSELKHPEKIVSWKNFWVWNSVSLCADLLDKLPLLCRSVNYFAQDFCLLGVDL